jgi:dTDP-4-dehydrorhamnose 3,5-epimerase
MQFTKTNIEGVFVIELDKNEDERGFFARSWDALEAKKAGCPLEIVQCNVSFNKKEGTLRGLHYQVPPYEEAKVVQCTAGAVYDVALDLRMNSPTYKEWVPVELSSDNRRALYIPKGCAHGFQTLTNNAELFYLMGAYYNADAARGARWDDPVFQISWPKTRERIISEKDRSYPNWEQ